VIKNPIFAPPQNLIPSKRRRRSAPPSAAKQLTDLLAALTKQSLPIDAEFVQVACEAMSMNSLAARLSDLGCFSRFCAKAQVIGLPASAATLMSYTNKLNDMGLSLASITRRLSSIAATHKLLALASATQPHQLRLRLQGLRRQRGTRQRQALALRLGQGIGQRPRTNRPTGLTLTALLAACGTDLQGLRDAALLSLGYDGGLRVSELTAVTVADLQVDPDDRSGLLFIPKSKTDQTGQGSYAWVSPDSVRRIEAWQAAADISSGLLFRRVHLTRTKADPGQAEILLRDLAYHAKVDSQRMQARPARAAKVAYTIGTEPLTRQGVCHIYRRVARQAVVQGHAAIDNGQLDATIAALSTHSLRVGLTQDLFAAGEDAGPVAQALRWTSPVTALRYARHLVPKSNAAARVLAKVRG
jgi:integrase